MIKLREFLSIFRDIGFSDGELRLFYYSVGKTVILRMAGKRSWSEIFRIEEQCQWPVVRKIDDPGLTIYKGADKELLERFIETIRSEKSLREHKAHLDKVRYWTRLQAVISERIDLFTQIFGFSNEDIGHCEKVAARYSHMVDGRIARRKKLWTIGIGTGAATLAGAAAAWYFYNKEKK